MTQLDITDLGDNTSQIWTHKSIRENFQRWLEAPESAAPFDFQKICKTLGYSMDLTQRNLAPAVPFIMLVRILAEAKDMQQVKRATRWFLKVGEEGFRFKHSNQFLEFMRRAMEHRRATGTSWDGWDIWRAREDHTLVAQGSRIRLEQRGDYASIWEPQVVPKNGKVVGEQGQK